jgi:GNAT superfamily N-acetyltransferase
LSIAIKKATSQDAPALSHMLRGLELFAQVSSEDPQSTQEQVSRYLQLYDRDDCRSLYVALDAAGEIVGYGAVHWLPYLFLAGPSGEVSELFVCAAERGRGIGSRLLDSIRVEALARGCSRLSLVNLRHRESYGRGFYAKRGWQERPEAVTFVYPLEQGGGPPAEEAECCAVSSLT